MALQDAERARRALFGSNPSRTDAATAAAGAVGTARARRRVDSISPRESSLEPPSDATREVFDATLRPCPLLDSGSRSRLVV